MHFSNTFSIVTALASLLGHGMAAVTSNPESVFSDLNILNTADRQTEYLKLPTTSQRAFWIGKFEAYRAKHHDDLNEEQLNALGSAISSANSTDPTESEEEVKKAMLDAFGQDTTTTLLATLEGLEDGHGSKRNADDDDSHSGNVLQKRGVCECAVDSNFCVKPACNPSESCKVEKGCGYQWLHYCNGKCEWW